MIYGKSFVMIGNPAEGKPSEKDIRDYALAKLILGIERDIQHYEGRKVNLAESDVKILFEDKASNGAGQIIPHGVTLTVFYETEEKDVNE